MKRRDYLLMTEWKLVQINKKHIIIIMVTLIMLLAIILIGPLDFFSHGFYCNVVDWDSVAAEDFGDPVQLENGDFEMDFSPIQDHFVGFGIYLLNQPGGNSGNLIVTLYDENRNQIDYIIVDISKVIEAELYRIYVNADLEKGKKYILKFVAEDCSTAPYLPTVDRDYLSGESESSNIFLGGGYAEPTFTFQDKLLIAFFIISIYGFIGSKLIFENKKQKIVSTVAISIFMTTFLLWNYMYNSFDNYNTLFDDFQVDSESLVAGVIKAERDDVYFLQEEEHGYGLGRYINSKGKLSQYWRTYRSDDNWVEGYSKKFPAIIVDSNVYTKMVASAGNYVGFSNGAIFEILSIEDDGTNIAISLSGERVLMPAKYGSLDNIRFYDTNLQQLAPSLITAYKSQYGLQGKVFRHFSRYLNHEETIANLHLLCGAVTAFVFVIIVMLIAQKYNFVLAGVFFVTFWLSPWIVNFARNLYWVEFTWFLPMAIGLFCACKIQTKRCRIISYASAFVAILGKCLCGYEYISVIMMGMVAFLVVDLIQAVVKKETALGKLIFRTIMIIGIIAIFGFIVAICIHASLRGNGNILGGMKDIFEQDVLRRTNGANLNDIGADNLDSLNASVWEVCCRYFKFSTEIITGISGNLFPLLCLIPLCIFVNEYRFKRLNIEHLSMYVVFFLTSFSWFCLAKSHSYVHIHMNYVLWYFGFVQICFYIIVDKIIKIYLRARR